MQRSVRAADAMRSQMAKRPRLGDRTMLACIGCKQKKLKCDGQIPQCRNCAKIGRDCLVEDPATGLRRPRNYTQSLESRIALLEGALEQLHPGVAVDHILSGSAQERSRLLETGNMAAGSDGELSEIDTISPSHSKENITSDVALLCLNAAGREPQYFGPSSALSFARVASSTLRLNTRDGLSQGIDSAIAAQTAQRRTGLQFPPPQDGLLLSQAFFDNIHPQYPFLHKPTYRLWELECHRANSVGDLNSLGDIPLFFVLMVYAIGTLIASTAEQAKSETYYSMAINHAGSVMQLDGLEAVQAILGCAVYSIKSPAGASVWKLSGMAIRQSIELGYHRSTTIFRPHANVLVKEMSKRVFWIAYDMDRSVALVTGRPFGISDELIDAELPMDVDDSDITPSATIRPPRGIDDAPNHMTGAIHIIKLRRIWSRIGMALYPAMVASSCDTDSFCESMTNTIGTLRHDVEEWYQNSPSQLEASVNRPLSVFASKEWFRLAYCHTILLLYRHNLVASRSSNGVSSAQHAAFEECAARAKEICLLYRRSYQSGPVQYTWGSVHILFMAGLTYLHCLWSSESIRVQTRKSDVVNTCTSCTMVLVIIAERWSTAVPYRDIFEALAQRTISMVCEEPENQVREPLQPAPPRAESPSNLDFSLFDDWIMNLEELTVPDGSEWLIQELCQATKK